MNTSSRILINTFSLYLKLIVTIVINLLLVRIVLAKLGVDDYGIYNLIAGAVALLSFLNSALMSSSQRFLSVAIGEGDLNQVMRIMSSSVIIHLAFGVILVLLFELFEPLLFEKIINVQPDRIPAAKIVYQLMILSTVITVFAVPYNALINAREDLWFFAIVEIAVALMKLFIIFLFKHIEYDSLLLYTIWILITTIVGCIAKTVWCFVKYRESRGSLSFANNKAIFKRLLSFTGWNALGSLAQAGRNQGVVLTINHFFGTAISAVFGIANQMDGNLVYFSQMLTASVSPQIMISYGQKDIKRMLRLSVFTSKMAFLLSGVIALPILVEMPYILDIWLKDVPQYALEYCRLVLIVFLIMQLYPGLVRAIQATGDIKWYQIGQSILLLLPIPLGIVLFRWNYVNYSIVYLMVIAQVLMMLYTIVIAKIKTGLDVKSYLVFIIKAIALLSLSLVIAIGVHSFLNHCHRFLLLIIVSLVSCSIFVFTYYFIVFNLYEKTVVKEKIRSIIDRFIRILHI